MDVRNNLTYGSVCYIVSMIPRMCGSLHASGRSHALSAAQRLSPSIKFRPVPPILRYALLFRGPARDRRQYCVHFEDQGATCPRSGCGRS
jgi:hypothetical protein